MAEASRVTRTTTFESRTSSSAAGERLGGVNLPTVGSSSPGIGLIGGGLNRNDEMSNSRSSSSNLQQSQHQSSSHHYETEMPAYKTQITPRHLVINRTSAYGLGAGSGMSNNRSVSVERSSRYGSVPSGAYAVVTTSGVNQVKNSREREKKDMQDLNERFAGYIEKVRFLEAQNRRLADELEKLKAKWGKETTQIKAMFHAELDEARKLLDDSEKEKARLEIKVASLEEQLQEMRLRFEDGQRSLGDARDKLERQNQQLSDYEAEINLLRRRMESFETEREKDKKQIATLQDALNRSRIDLDNETLLHIDAENRRQTLEEELEFLKSVHEQEMKELAALAYKDTTAENREFWKNEMGQALREIQQVYDEKLEGMKAEMETFYNLKIQEFRTGSTKQNMEVVHAKEEVKRLKTQLTEIRDKYNDIEGRFNQLQRELEHIRREKEERERELENENSELKNEVAKLRAEMEAILRELQDIMDTKLGLELEIAAYRKLLEGEENRIGLKQVVDTWMSSGHVEHSDDSTMRVSQVVKGEMSAKTTYQRSAKGPVSIAECSADGKYIVVENTGRKEENLGNWRLTRIVDGLEKADYSFKNDYALRPSAKSKLWVLGHKPGNAPASDIETSVLSWGTGANITTRLINQTGEERATHVQKTMYSS